MKSSRKKRREAILWGKIHSAQFRSTLDSRYVFLWEWDYFRDLEEKKEWQENGLMLIKVAEQSWRVY